MKMTSSLCPTIVTSCLGSHSFTIVSIAFTCLYYTSKVLNNLSTFKTGPGVC